MSSQSGASIDDARVLLEFLDATSGVLATYDSGPARPVNEWVRLVDERTVPAGTRALRVRLRGTRTLSITTDALFDSLSLVLGGQTLDVPGVSPHGAALRLRVLTNPARGAGTFEIALARAGALDVRILDTTGAVVRRLAGDHAAAGARRMTWDGRRDDGSLAAPGVYLVKATSGSAKANGRIVLIR